MNRGDELLHFEVRCTDKSSKPNALDKLRQVVANAVDERLNL
ncbi:MAG: hypothetical protein ABSF69_21500 [Polyangiaceae bacterium]|jgi:hypothetical protein